LAGVPAGAVAASGSLQPAMVWISSTNGVHDGPSGFSYLATMN
jgi:hypothetical protein